MKKVLIGLFIIAVLICALNEEPKEKTTYTKEEVEEAVREAESRAYDEGYADAKYYLKPEIWEAENIAADRGYEAGYEIGYEDGYYDCLVEHGLVAESEQEFGLLIKDN